MRVFTTLIPIDSKPPTTADAGNFLELKFDNTLNDSSGINHNATLAGGATYVNTPNQIAVSLPKTPGAPTWTNWTSLRAGRPAQLDGSASYSLADVSSSVNYSWQQLSGPTTVVWTSRHVAIPTITGLIFGTYTFQLTVVDVTGASAVTILQTGAVAYSDSGVIIPPNPAVTQVFGPLIAFGQNPWGYEDERHLAAVNLQSAPGGALYQYVNTQTWTTPGQGTVSYPFSA